MAKGSDGAAFWSGMVDEPKGNSGGGGPLTLNPDREEIPEDEGNNDKAEETVDPNDEEVVGAVKMDVEVGVSVDGNADVVVGGPCVPGGIEGSLKVALGVGFVVAANVRLWVGAVYSCKELCSAGNVCVFR
jgi:hypothetical protein